MCKKTEFEYILWLYADQLTRVTDAAGRQHFDLERAMPNKPLRRITVALLCWFVCFAYHLTVATGEEVFPVAIRVDAAPSAEPLMPVWRFFGADEPNYATLPNGEKLLAELGELDPQNVYFRAHSLLCSGDGTPALKWGSTGVYREDAAGKPIYDWTILDQIFDAYKKARVRPYVQIGFMPEDLSTRPEPYQHNWKPGDPYDRIFTGWAYPPKDYDKWEELVYEWTKHCLDRYGREEVETWYWEVWNESNAGYWKGTPEEFLKLHDYAIAGVRRALPNAKVGGADTAGDGGQFTRRFVEHCLRGKNFATGEVGTPLDFVAFHAKGSPSFVDGHVRMGIANQLRTIDAGFRIVASYPETKPLPIVIGESDPDGCAACGAKVYPQNDYRNGSLYASYTAASFARKHELAKKHGVNLEGALTWAFEFEGQPYFAGYRSLATNGIDKPVLNVFRMFSKMRGNKLLVTSDHAVPLDAIVRRGVRDKPDVAALAARDGNRIAVMIWHYHDDDVPGSPADVNVTLEKLAVPNGTKELALQHFRIDDDHSNAFTVWKQMGSPQEPSAEQYKALETAGQLTELKDSVSEIPVVNDAAAIRFALPRQAVSLLILEAK